MQLKAYTRLGGETIVSDDVTYVYVEDQQGNPLIIACELADGMYDVSKVGDSDFEDVLRALGVAKTVVVGTVGGPPAGPRDKPLALPRR